MNEHEIERVAAAANALRPDWPTGQLRTLIRDKLADRPRRDVAVALSWVACESGTASPYRVLEAGPWWQATGQFDVTAKRNPKPAECCATCGRWMHTPDPICESPAAHRPPRDVAAHQAGVARLRATITPLED